MIESPVLDFQTQALADKRCEFGKNADCMCFVGRRHTCIDYCYKGRSTPTTKKSTQVYLIGSLRNANVPLVAEVLRNNLSETIVFDDWFAAGPEADDKWKEYEQGRNRSYKQALAGEAAKNVYAFDKRHLDASDFVVLVLPAGKSGHLELGYCAGKGKRTYILLDAENDRWDVMYQFADLVTYDSKDIVDDIKKHGGY